MGKTQDGNILSSILTLPNVTHGGLIGLMLYLFSIATGYSERISEIEIQCVRLQASLNVLDRINSRLELNLITTDQFTKEDGELLNTKLAKRIFRLEEIILINHGTNLK